MGRVIDELRAKHLLTVSDGASIVDLDEEKTGMPPCLILKKDGATLYATRDIAAALWRKDEYDFDKCLYVVAYQQDLHFRQWFKVVEKMGYEWAKDLVHVAFGMISYEGQSLSTRKGHVVFLEDLLLNAIDKARSIIEEKSPGLDNKDEVARQVGIGAVIYADLQNNRIKDIDFSWSARSALTARPAPTCSTRTRGAARRFARPRALRPQSRITRRCQTTTRRSCSASSAASRRPCARRRRAMSPAS